MLQKASYLVIPLIIIYLSAWMIQSTLLFNWDVSWGLQEAKRLLAGGHYAKEFFEPSPPMFLYLYSLPVMLSKFFSIPITLAFRLFIFVLASLSLCLCGYLLWSNKHNDRAQSNLFLLTLAATFLALPLPTDFGQREHLFFILIMPYVLLVYSRLLSNNSAKHTILIGLFASIGLAIKPFFPITLVFLEAYYIYRKKNYLAWLRAETITVFLVLITYIVIIFLFHRDYITIILPLIARYHYHSYHFPWTQILFNFPMFFCGLILLLYFIQYPMIKQIKEINILTSVLIVSFISFLLIYILQRSPWEYHLFPAFSLAIILTILLFDLLLHPFKTSHYLMEKIGLILLLIIFFASYYPTIWTIIIFSPSTFFSFLTVFCLAILRLAYPNKNAWWLSSLTLLMIAISFLVATFLKFDTWNAHQFSMTLLTFSMLLTLCILRSNTKSDHLIVTSYLVFFISALPTYHTYLLINGFMAYKDTMKPLINAMRILAPQQSVYFLSTTMVNEFPIIDDTTSQPISQYPSFAWLAGIIKQYSQTNNSHQLQQLNDDKAYFVKNIANELDIFKPTLVFIDVQKNKPYLENYNFDYINELSSDPTFRMAWRNYQYYATIEKTNAYKFALYRRK
ncbi:MAG: hypothetical protein A3F11_08870 [Gammaproteobacteria bacterium RIFCSPHIGHO2_12_FULL_37_14]|nr:MAG: hypothetical protein A3F11_08870 [Gammaproteobacteria bacterium RIFCSPHIGHO2_12_FULL_37_14]